MNNGWRVSSEYELEVFIEYLREGLKTGADRTFYVRDTTRTSQQNRCIHAFCGALAGSLEERGVGMKPVIDVIASRLDVNPTKEGIKESVWKPIQKAITCKDSTTQLTTEEVSKVAQSVQRMASEYFDISIPFGYLEMAMEGVDGN